MNMSLTVADLAPAIFGAVFGLLAVGGALFSSRRTRALRRRRRAAGTQKPGSAALGDDAAKARELAKAIVRLLSSHREKGAGASPAE